MAGTPNELDAIEALAAMAEGRLSAEALTVACLERVAARDGVVHAFVHVDPDARDRRSAPPRSRAPRRIGRPAQRLAVRREGHHRHARHADLLRLADPRRSSSVGGCGVRRAGARGRRGDARQDGDDRIRAASSGPDREPAQSRAHAGRIVERIRRRRRRLHGAGGVRDADRRLDHPSGVVLRRGRLQALDRHDQSDRREAARRQLRHRGTVRALRRRLRRGGRRACGRGRHREARRGAPGARRCVAHAGMEPRRAADRARRRHRGGAARARRRHRRRDRACRPSSSFFSMRKAMCCASRRRACSRSSERSAAICCRRRAATSWRPVRRFRASAIARRRRCWRAAGRFSRPRSRLTTCCSRRARRAKRPPGSTIPARRCSTAGAQGLHVPCLNLPCFSGPKGLPVGIQVVGAIDDDARLLRAAKWIMGHVGDVPRNA